MQLPGDVWAKLSPECFIPVRGVNGPTQQILKVHNTSSVPNLNLNKERPDIYQLVTGRLRKLWNSGYLICKTHCYWKPVTWNDEMHITCAMSGSAIWTCLSEALSAPRIYYFEMGDTGMGVVVGIHCGFIVHWLQNCYALSLSFLDTC